MKETIISFILVVLLAGCFGTVQPKPTTEVPIEVKCEPAAIEKPVESLNESNVNLTLFEKLQRALSDLQAYKGYSVKLEAAATKCVKPKETVK